MTTPTPWKRLWPWAARWVLSTRRAGRQRRGLATRVRSQTPACAVPSPQPNPCLHRPPSRPRLQPDRSGAVSVERLARTIAEFELRVDLPALLMEMDVDADGEVGCPA